MFKELHAVLYTILCSSSVKNGVLFTRRTNKILQTCIREKLLDFKSKSFIPHTPNYACTISLTMYYWPICLSNDCLLLPMLIECTYHDKNVSINTHNVNYK